MGRKRDGGKQRITPAEDTRRMLAGKSHGQGSLAGYSPQGHKESDTT